MRVSATGRCDLVVRISKQTTISNREDSRGKKIKINKKNKLEFDLLNELCFNVI